MEDNVTSTPLPCCSFQNHLAPPEHRKWRRIHGLQLPLHPQQIVGWLALLGFAVVAFTILIPALCSSLRPPLLILLASLIFLHVIAHFCALFIDPADKNLRALKTSLSIPEFDRSKHAHVIENGRCHLCNIRTSSPRTKHCSVCNKCVERFDHHCKWLNHCIGGRNYVAFLVCVVSAVAASLLVVAVSIAEFVFYYLDPGWLSFWESAQYNGTISDLAEIIPYHNNVYLSVVGVVGILALITAGLLLHLCFFHIYIGFLGITTYEYIRSYRHTSTVHKNENSIPMESATITQVSVLESNRQSRFCLSRCCYPFQKNNANIQKENHTDTLHGTLHTIHYNCRVKCDGLSKGIMSHLKCPCSYRGSSDTSSNENKTDSIRTEYNKTTTARRKIPFFVACLCRKRDLSGIKESCKLENNTEITKRVITIKRHRQVNFFKLCSCFSCIKPRSSEHSKSQARNQVGPSSQTEQQEKECGNPITSVQENTYANSVENNYILSAVKLPALGPPSRRRLRNLSELKQLGETLALVQQSQDIENSSSKTLNSPCHAKLQRKKSAHLHKTMSPTLSPIRESGLSNPPSPNLSRFIQSSVAYSCPSSPEIPRIIESVFHEPKNYDNSLIEEPIFVVRAPRLRSGLWSTVDLPY